MEPDTKVIRIVSTMVSVTATIAVPSANITMLLVDPHPDPAKAPTWLGHVRMVNPVNGTETTIDLVFPDAETAFVWRDRLVNAMNTTVTETY